MIALPRRVWAASALVLLAGCATAPHVRVPIAQFPVEQQARAAENIRIFNTVWDLVERKHFDPKLQGLDWEEAAAKFAPAAAVATDEQSLYVVLNQMLNLLHDSHTHALTPAQALERHTHERARTGFNLTRVENRWVVTDVVPDSPADKAGVRPRWIAVAVNGERLGDRVEFRPREGDETRWEFLDERDQPVALTLKAKRLSTAALQIERELPGGFIYLRFDEFDGRDRRWLSRQLKEHEHAPGVVLDVRRNPGGDTFSLGTTIGEFFDHAVDCGTFITRGGARSVKNSWQLGSADYRGKVVVLIDGATGSAAEIFAAVLQSHHRAIVVGRKSAGAVLASWFYHLPDDGELQLSREDYLAPSGRRIEGNGVDPDVVVPRTLAEVRSGRDLDVDAALRVLQANAVPVP
jgi:carboxyl-terminal processing protease